MKSSLGQNYKLGTPSKRVRVSGWVHTAYETRRDIMFLDLRDETGLPAGRAIWLNLIIGDL